MVLKPPYEVTETGWGEFEVIIKIYFSDPNERPVSLCDLSDHLFTCPSHGYSTSTSPALPPITALCPTLNHLVTLSLPDSVCTVSAFAALF